MRRLVLLLLLAACTTTKPYTPPIPASFDNALWAILIEDDDGTVLYEQNADKLMVPASNRKLFASATIAACLGPTTQLTTDVYRDGEDLVVRGDGDPSLGSWRYFREGDFDRLAEALRAQGVTTVRDLIVDVSAFDRVIYPGGWKIGNIGSDYSAPVDAISWGENELANDRAAENPALHAGTVLREALDLHGIPVANIRVNTEPRALLLSTTNKVASIPSPFVAQLLQTVLKNSHNLYAEMLLKRSSNGTYDASFALERTLMSEIGVPRDTFRFVDGSGLAPDDLVAARTTVKLLRWMNEPSRRAFWWPILAQPNNEGTLRRRLVTLEDRLRGKTGTINGVAALSGIIAMPNGRFRYFSIMVNHHIGDGDEVVKVIDDIVMYASSP
ncbi:MAG TPA: D-alanyl-D-alanine carboxypeptidase [Thermoanaerobaculia bacterium]|nr:D-alanyl-D-alanine carboxypeptidase [Thermoanaerobaculia bacterium]